MKILTIIGNGFDLGHHLPTRFDQFIKSDASLFCPKYEAFNDSRNSWKHVESIYGDRLTDILSQRSWHDITEVVDEIIREYGLNDYGEVDYYNYVSDAFDEEYCKIRDYVELLTEFEYDFQEYLKETCGDNQLLRVDTYDGIGRILLASSKIITFNYTHTVEVAYGLLNIEHIHGDIGTKIAIGSGALDSAKESLIDHRYPTIEKFSNDKYGFAEMMAYYEETDDGELVENHFITRFFDEVASAASDREKEIFSLLDLKSKDSLESRRKVIAALSCERYDKVFIIGHSLGDADFSVLDALDKTAEIICFYHSESERPQMEMVLDKLRYDYTLISDSELYQWNGFAVKVSPLF